MVITSKELASASATAVVSTGEEEAEEEGDCFLELIDAVLYETLKCGSPAWLATWDVSTLAVLGDGWAEEGELGLVLVRSLAAEGSGTSFVGPGNSVVEWVSTELEETLVCGCVY